MAIYKKGENYYIDYYVNGHRKREKIGPSKKLAKAVLQKRKVEIAENKYLDKRQIPKTTFKELARLYIAYAKLNKKSWIHNVYNIKNLISFFGEDTLISDITALKIEEFKAYRRQKVKSSTVNRDLACLKHMFTKAIEWGKTVDNPTKKVKLFKENNKRLRYLTKVEIERLLQASAGHLKPILITALHTGMRKSEIFNLKWEDIDFNNKVIQIVNTKSGDKRYIPIDATLMRTLKGHIRKIHSPYVFSNQEGKPYCDLKRSFHSALKKAGIEDFTFHDLRHTFASHLVMSGADLTTVKELLGHKKIDMTLRYSHLSPDHKRRAVEVLDTYMDTREESEKSKLL